MFFLSYRAYFYKAKHDQAEENTYCQKTIDFSPKKSVLFKFVHFVSLHEGFKVSWLYHFHFKNNPILKIVSFPLPVSIKSKLLFIVLCYQVHIKKTIAGWIMIWKGNDLSQAVISWDSRSTPLIPHPQSVNQKCTFRYCQMCPKAQNFHLRPLPYSIIFQILFYGI